MNLLRGMEKEEQTIERKETRKKRDIAEFKAEEAHEERTTDKETGWREGVRRGGDSKDDKEN